MGIKKYIIFLLVFCVNKSSFAQKNNDTIYINNQFFIKHIVKYGESIDDISKLHNVSVNKILLTNETSTKLYKDQTLFIPLEKKSSKNSELKSNKKYKIGLLLPFYKNLNDTLIASFEDKEEASQIILGKSVMALEIMQGVDLALDSIEKLGIAIDMNVIDTRNDSAKVVDIIKSKVLDTMDLIIGPIYSRNMQLVMPNKSYGLNKKLEAKSILFKNATLWTNEDLGIVKSSSKRIGGSYK